MKRLNYLWIFLILAGTSFGVWDNVEPADSTPWDQAAGFIRANNNALEVVLGIDLSMEGSAYPWFQPTAPSTKADGSTALDSTDDGFLWIDSDTRALYAYIDGTGFRGVDSLPAVVTFTAADATPTVVLSSIFTTDSGGLTITDFDDGLDGKVIYVLSKGAIVYDTTTAQDADHNLDGSSANITTASGDITVWRNEGGTTWHLVVFNDASVDNAEKDFATTTYVDNADGTLQTNIDDVNDNQNFGALTITDSESNSFLEDHAYLAQQDGIVYATVTDTGTNTLQGFNGATSDPGGAGIKVQEIQIGEASNTIGSITFAVASGRYFEVRATAAVDGFSMAWQPTQTTGGAPVDQD